MKRLSLVKKTIITTFCISMLVGATLAAAGMHIYTKNMDYRYKENAEHGARFLADQVSGDEVEEYARKLRNHAKDPESIKDEKYEQIEARVQYIQQCQGLTNLYIAAIVDGELVYLFDTDTALVGEEVNKYGWMSSSSMAISNTDGTIVAFACADVDLNDIKAQRQEFLLEILAMVSFVALSTGIIIVYILNRSIVAPIRQLSKATGNFVQVKEKGPSPLAKLEIHTGDEIEELADSIASMEKDLQEYLRNLTRFTVEKERSDTELQVARRIQGSTLPVISETFPGSDKFDIYADMKPAREVGGDFFDCFFVDKNHFAIVIADVSGKGVPAALFMVIAKTLIKNQVQLGGNLSEIITIVNQQLCAENDADMFVTAWIGVLELSSRKMRYVNAGHNPPLLKRTNGTFGYLRVRNGLMLAGFEHSVYGEKELVLDDGDTIFLYTDGVTEARNREKEFFGEKRLKHFLNQLEANAPEELIKGVHEEMNRFVDGAQQSDDITMLALRMTGIYHDITVEAKLGNESIVMDFVEQDLLKRGCEKEVIGPLKIVVDELFANVVHYSGSDQITVGCSYMNGQASIRFIDDGVPYNPLQAEEVDTSLSLEEREIGGLGILMVSRLTDDMEHEYHDGKNIVTVRKRCM